MKVRYISLPKFLWEEVTWDKALPWSVRNDSTQGQCVFRHGAIFPSTWFQVSMNGVKGFNRDLIKFWFPTSWGKEDKGRVYWCHFLDKYSLTFLLWDKNLGGNSKWDHQYFLLLTTFLFKTEKKHTDLEASTFCLSSFCYLKYTIHKS